MTWRKFDKRVLIHDVKHSHRRWLDGLANYLRSRGVGVHVHMNKKPLNQEQTGWFDHALIWNGLTPYHRAQEAVAREVGLPVSYVEVGWFPQGRYLHLDDKGLGVYSTLADDLPEASEGDLQLVEKVADELAGGRRWNQDEAEDYVLVPLQLENDMQITEFSPFKTMRAFMDHCEEELAGENIVFRRHPKDKKHRFRAVVARGPIHEAILGAKMVYGINSTSLFEAQLLGAPVRCQEGCLLKTHEGRERDLIAAMVAKQIPVGAADIGKWVDPVFGHLMS